MLTSQRVADACLSCSARGRGYSLVSVELDNLTDSSGRITLT